MARFTLRYSGGTAPQEHTDLAAAAPNVTILDRTPKMMLIDADEDDAKNLASRLSGWTLHPEVEYQIPDTRKRIVNDA
ncbi:MAG TPA: hypothetical protein VHW09_19140 [Bryobacteraceae bacterium]|jgi:hypothetical protein|nr:hypothetical protein [Bryobacteraceae bacterium]